MAKKEFPLSDDEFKTISSKVYQACGIVLGEHKREMVYSRLARRIRACGLSSFAEYIDYLDKNQEAEFSEFINAITTNLTSFFRESYHFDYLAETIIPQIKDANRHSKRVRIWSAGCSTGQEPYSIAMTIYQQFPRDWDVKILATDLDSNVLAKAQAGEYGGNDVNGLAIEKAREWFLRSKSDDTYRIKPEIKQLISFKRLNLLQEWPMRGKFDVIFCRNVVIYFDKPTKEALFSRYAGVLKDNGYLFLGHSESMGKDQLEFVPLGRTMYRKA